WVEERVVVAASALDEVHPGDVVTAIDGVSIDIVLAQLRVRTPAATARAAVVRAVARLLEREQKGAAITLALLRRIDRDERALTARVVAEHRSDRWIEPADARPRKPLV